MKWNIGNVEIKNQIVLAPMAGISNPSYMKICEEMGVGYVVTELISSEAIVRNNKKTLEMLNGISDLNIPVGIQIFGDKPNVMAEAAKVLCDNYSFDVIDINMGCPVPKVAIKSKAGSALLKDIEKIEEIVSAVVKASSVPVSVKIRSGWDESNINAVEVSKAIEKSGASALTIHARTRSQGYSGASDWDIIKKIKESITIPVIGNGDVTTPELAKKMLDDTKCDAVMIGRGVLGNPWLIKECIDYLKTGVYDNNITIQDKINMLKKHLDYLRKYKNEKVALLEIRSHALWYLKNIPNAATIKNKICLSKSIDEIFNLLNKFLNENISQ